MAQAAELLIGREDELAALGRALDELDGGRSRAVALGGEPGIGKTRLLRQLAALAEERQDIVLSGSASELERDVLFSVFVSALGDYVGGVDANRLGMLDEQDRTALGHVFPSLSGLARGRQAPLRHERHRTYRAVRNLLDVLAESTPLVLVLDDVHWADPASIELLDFLLRHPPAAPVLLAVSARTRQRPDRLASALERAFRDGALEQIELAAFTRDEARALIDGDMDSARATALYEESGGNPFYLQQLAKRPSATREERPGASELSLAIEVPPAVAAALAEEIGSLSDDVRLVLQGAAVVGDPFEPEFVADAAATPESSALDAIDELLRRDLIRQTDVPRRFRFRHPLVKRAVYETTRHAWRIDAHARCAESLGTRGAAPAVRAYHLERSARIGDMEAVRILRAAGEEAGRVAPASAARWFAGALRLLPQNAPAPERVALLLARAGALAAAGRLVESHADLLDSVELVSTGARDWRVRVATACATVEHLLGLQSEAHRHLVSALTQLEDADSEDAVELMIALSMDALYGGEIDVMRDWAERAVAAARPLGDRALLAAALAVRAWAFAFAGEGDRGRGYCSAAAEVVDELSDAQLARRLDCLAHLASADLYLDRLSQAVAHAQRALRIGRSTGQGDMFPIVLVMLGRALWIQGRVHEAAELFDGAIEAARLARNPQSLAWNLVNRSFAALAAGEIDLALTSASEGFELARDTELAPLAGSASAALASALLESGDAGRAADVLLAGTGGEEMLRIGGSWRARFLELLTRAMLATGRRADAERAAAATQARAEAVALPSAVAMSKLAAAALAVDSGEAARAAEHALAAAELLESVGALYDAARARALAGRALAAAGRRDSAAVQLELAATAFDSFGSLRYRNQAERELRKLGRRIHRRTRPGINGGAGIEALTERELEIAHLVADRRTNAQIAAELFLSEKTVEAHLRNIFNKMDVASRVDLARAVERGSDLRANRT